MLSAVCTHPKLFSRGGKFRDWAIRRAIDSDLSQRARRKDTFQYLPTRKFHPASPHLSNPISRKSTRIKSGQRENLTIYITAKACITVPTAKGLSLSSKAALLNLTLNYADARRTKLVQYNSIANAEHDKETSPRTLRMNM